MKKNTTTLFIISRNFVEFGAFTAAEVTSFRQRGVLSDHDYVRAAESPDWLPLGLWMTDVATSLVGSKPAAVKAAPRKRSATPAKASKKAA